MELSSGGNTSSTHIRSREEGLSEDEAPSAVTRVVSIFACRFVKVRGRFRTERVVLENGRVLERRSLGTLPMPTGRHHDRGWKLILRRNRLVGFVFL